MFGRIVRRPKRLLLLVAVFVLLMVMLAFCQRAEAYETREMPYERLAPLCPSSACEPVCVVEVATETGRTCYGWVCSCPPIVGGAA
jgi:hypothetical protein